VRVDGAREAWEGMACEAEPGCRALVWAACPELAPVVARGL